MPFVDRIKTSIEVAGAVGSGASRPGDRFVIRLVEAAGQLPAGINGFSKVVDAAAAPVRQTGVLDYNSAIRRAQKMLQDNDAARALPMLTEAIAHKPSDGDAYALRAQAYMNIGNYDAALRDNLEAARRSSRPSKGDPDRAFLLRMLGREDDAVTEIRNLSASRDRSDLRAAASYLASFERYDEADAMLVKLRELGGSIAEILVLRGQIYKPNAVAVRLSDLERGLAYDPKSVFGYQTWGDLLRQTRDHAKAIVIYSRGLTIDGNNAVMLAGREASYRALGKVAEADRDAATLTRSGNRWFALFMACRAKGETNVDLPSALAACDAALAEQPKSPGILHDRGVVLLRQKRFAEAILTFDQALMMNRNLAEPYFGRSLAKTAIGDAIGASADAAMALRIDPRTDDEFKTFGLTP